MVWIRANYRSLLQWMVTFTVIWWAAALFGWQWIVNLLTGWAYNVATWVVNWPWPKGVQSFLEKLCDHLPAHINVDPDVNRNFTDVTYVWLFWLLALFLLWLLVWQPFLSIFGFSSRGTREPGERYLHYNADYRDGYLEGLRHWIVAADSRPRGGEPRAATVTAAPAGATTTTTTTVNRAEDNDHSVRINRDRLINAPLVWGLELFLVIWIIIPIIWNLFIMAVTIPFVHPIPVAWGLGTFFGIVFGAFSSAIAFTKAVFVLALLVVFIRALPEIAISVANRTVRRGREDEPWDMRRDAPIPAIILLGGVALILYLASQKGLL